MGRFKASRGPKIAWILPMIIIVSHQTRPRKATLMTNSHTDLPPICSGTSNTGLWQPVRPPRRGASDAAKAAFQAYILIPGLSVAFHAATLGRSRSSIAKYRRQAQEAAMRNPDISSLVLAQLNTLNAEAGLQMAQCRGAAQLPHWSLLAICDFRERGISRRQIASDFRCSLGTVAHTLQFRNRSYEPLSGARRLTKGQQGPPKQFKARIAQ